MFQLSTQRFRKFLFHPATVLCLSLLATLCFSLSLIALSRGKTSFYSLYYVAPIGVPFAAFLFDRVERWREIIYIPLVIDVFIVGLSLARAEVAIPLLSGHSLFLSYALLTARSRVAQITALLVMIQVLYLKLFVWHDFEVFGGILLGCVAGFFFRKNTNGKQLKDENN
jgi:hypothetical protein